MPVRAGVVIVLLVTAAARADADEKSHVTGSMSFAMGSYDVADLDGIAVPGLILDLGWQKGRLRLAGELMNSFLGAADPEEDERTGYLRRWGLSARWDLVARDLRREDGSGGVFSIYLEGGVGRQHATWTGGGEADRGDFFIGTGIAPRGHVGPIVMGVTCGVRLFVSEAIAAADGGAARVACAGGCAASSGRDVGFLFVMGIAVGK
jgi:hypothetical protein